MRLDALPGSPHLGYCTNIHAGEDWADVRDSLARHVPAIRARLPIAADSPLGIGLRLSEVAARALDDGPTRDAFAAQLADLGAYVFSVNAFPYGRFHGTRVKERAYLPDWGDDARLDYTLRCARHLAALAPADVEGSLSTVPVAIADPLRSATDECRMLRRLMGAVAGLAALERSTGRRLSLALEPEPGCVLETAQDARAFFETRLLSASALSYLVRLTGVSVAAAERLLRRHLGVCLDVCHAAVEFEEPAAALRALRDAGISVPKIQLSSAVRVPRMDDAFVAPLSLLDDGVWLHQVVVRGDHGGLAHFLDLDEALAAWRAGEARVRGEWRVHCHVPVHRASLGPLGTTRSSLRDVLAALRSEAASAHLEVETYTWDVLAASLGEADKSAAIAAELADVLDVLAPATASVDGPLVEEAAS